ncbi:uncharacterized protein [Watersipora subatra]|uniref:uncharacterized protein n=1 Tax=Watersipora subatra TaxID=2589382 RepID=UPI00355C0F56
MFQIPFLFCLVIFGAQLASSERFQGCYLDDSTSRDLPVAKAMGTSNSVQACVDHCTSRAYKYAGLQGSTCYCGDSFGKYCKVDNAECDTSCAGRSQEKCGSSNKNSVYSTNYLGCWSDSPIRDLENYTQIDSSEATIETCVALCQSRGYRYAGAQYYRQCFCSNSYGMYPEKERSSCSTPCHGNNQQKCGGSWANSVYDALYY